MSSQLTTAEEVTFDQVFNLAQRLRPVDQVRLMAKLAPKVEWMLEQVETVAPVQEHKPLRGLLADLGPAPSAKEIDDVQHEIWGVKISLSTVHAGHD